MGKTFLERVASAPISWGICEVPRWGEMLSIDRVLEEMSGLGIQALELGAPGFFPQKASEVRQYVQSSNMSLHRTSYRMNHGRKYFHQKFDL